MYPKKGIDRLPCYLAAHLVSENESKDGGSLRLCGVLIENNNLKGNKEGPTNIPQHFSDKVEEMGNKRTNHYIEFKGNLT